MEPRSQINVGNRIHSFSTRGHESSSRGGSFPTLGGAILERLNEGIGSDDSRGEPEERRSSRIRSIRKPSSLLIPGSREISVGMRRNGAPHSWPARALSRYNRGQRIQRPEGSQNGAQTRGPTSFQLARCFLEARNRHPVRSLFRERTSGWNSWKCATRSSAEKRERRIAYNGMHYSKIQTSKTKQEIGR